MSFTFTTPVRFADVDHAGIVYYPRFFHYFHIAFEELWRSRIGARAYRDLIDRERVGFPAVRAECDFKAPLKFGDTIDVVITVPQLGTKSIAFRYRVYRVAEGEDTPTATDDRERTLCADGTVTCAVVDLARFVAMPIPERVIAMLSDLTTDA